MISISGLENCGCDQVWYKSAVAAHGTWRQEVQRQGLGFSRSVLEQEGRFLALCVLHVIPRTTDQILP